MGSTVTTPRTGLRVAGFGRSHPRAVRGALLLATAVAIARLALPAAVKRSIRTGIGSWLTSTASALTWTTVLCLTVMIGLQYLASTVAARAAAGVDLPFGELLAVQFAGTAANSITPVGLGGATVNGRYFARRGGLPAPQAGAAISLLALLGGMSDVLAFGLLIGLGSILGITGATSEAPLLLHRLTGWIPTTGSTWMWVVGVATLVAAGAATLARRRGSHTLRQLAAGSRSYGRTIAMMLRRPGRLAVLMGASASTTLLMAAGFAGVATLGPAALPLGTFGALMIGYMIASAAGNAVPTPGGIGAADAAFAGVLIAANVPVATAVGTVLAYRLITLWAPVALGTLFVRPLHRRGAL